MDTHKQLWQAAAYRIRQGDEAFPALLGENEEPGDGTPWFLTELQSLPERSSSTAISMAVRASSSMPEASHYCRSSRDAAHIALQCRGDNKQAGVLLIGCIAEDGARVLWPTTATC